MNQSQNRCHTFLDCRHVVELFRHMTYLYVSLLPCTF
jgi:hypothetical protein